MFSYFLTLHCLAVICYYFWFIFVIQQQPAEAEPSAAQPPSQQGIEELSAAVGGLRTVEEVMKYLEPDRWQVDMEELYRPTWHILGKSFILNKKAKGTTSCIHGS